MSEEEYPKICLNCAHCIDIGEGDCICDVDDPELVIADYEITDNYYMCCGADWEEQE